MDSAGFLVGSLLAGVLVAATSIQTAFLVTAGIFALAAWPLARMPRDAVPDHRGGTDEEGPLEELASGFRTVAADPSLRLLVGVLGVSTLVEGATDVLVVLVAIELLDLGGAGVGWLNSAWGVGGLVGGAAAISLLGRGRLAAGLAGGCLLVGVPLLIVAALPEVAVAVAMLGILGIGYSLIETAGLTLLQRLTSDDVLGRAFAVVESSYWLTTGIGAMIAPALVGLFGIRGALVALGLCLPCSPRCAGPAWPASRRAPRCRSGHSSCCARCRCSRRCRSARWRTSLRLTEIEVAAGHEVIREGEPGERFYVIAEGDFDVTCARGAFPSLRDGDVFGEIALLRDVPRTATVTARTDGLLYALDREAFLSAVGGHRFSARTAGSMADERAEQVPIA